MSFKPIPEHMRETLFHFSHIAIDRDQKIIDLTEQFKQYIADQSEIDGYISQLNQLDNDSLAEFFYEVAIGNCAYDDQSRTFYLDPLLKRSYQLDSIYLHLYKEALAEAIGPRSEWKDAELLRSHLDAVLDLTKQGKGAKGLILGNLTLDINPARGKIAISVDGAKLLLSESKRSKLEVALKQWHRAIHKLDYSIQFDEVFMP